VLDCSYDTYINFKTRPIYRDFEYRIDQFVTTLLKEYTLNNYTENKVIHDSVWGTTLFYPWELEILDSPLMQRLRYIRQLGLALYTYPSAHHTRFEHTLGVMSIATKMINHINQKDEKSIIPQNELYMVRLAALLHDVGHCFFSHLSERIYGNLKEFVELKQSIPFFKTAKAHEIFSFMIINTEAFVNFVERINKLKNNLKINDFREFFFKIGCMIIGVELPYAENNSGKVRKNYLTQIINGQYDADKLDYLKRDSYTSGLALTYDIDRLLHKIGIYTNDQLNEKGELIKCQHLIIPINGVTAVEEMVFNQLMLVSYIYQHQKVLTTDVLLQDIVSALKYNKKLLHPCDFLNFCDNDILNIYSDSQDGDFKMSISESKISSDSSTRIADIVKKINNRILPKRAFIINKTSIDDEHSKLFQVTDMADRPEKIIELREHIVNVARKIADKQYLPRELTHIEYFDVYISIPNISVVKDLSSALVRKNTKILSLSDVVRLHDWADAFANYKWNAYVFAKEEIIPYVSIASKIVFEKLGIIFKEDDETVFAGIKRYEETIRLIKIMKENGDYSSFDM
jgi:HD superfamily phosphohydrolase